MPEWYKTGQLNYQNLWKILATRLGSQNDVEKHSGFKLQKSASSKTKTSLE